MDEKARPADLAEQIAEKVNRSGKGAAVQLYRNLTGADLREATEYVEKMDSGLRSRAINLRSGVRKQASPIVLFGGLFLLGCTLFAIWGMIFIHNDKRQVLSEAPVSNISWSEIDAIYNLKSKYTDLQKDELWNQYKDKKIEWTGTVESISESFGSLVLQVKMNSSTFTSDLLITLKDSEKSKALNLKKGDSVTFTGILNRWGSILPIALKDGEIR